VMQRGAVALPPAKFEEMANREMALILDVRSKEDFVQDFIPNSIFIGLDGSFAPWVGELVPDLQQPILLVTEVGREAETVERLSRVGYDNALGYLEGGIAAWKDYGGETDNVQTIRAEEFDPRRASKVLDVRKESEYAGGHLRRSANLPLAALSQATTDLDADQQYFLHCGSGYRSTIAASILQSRGFNRIVNVQDKVADILATESVDA
ncbi:MAG: rhodanese-like domain-containing protein, partial [Lewinella sp.]